MKGDFLLDLASIKVLLGLWNEPNETVISAKETLYSAILRFVEEENEIEINKGNYDSYVSIVSIINKIKNSHPIPLEVIKNYLSSSQTVGTREELEIWIISTCINELVHEGPLLYIYDKQRVRSRIAETVRYFSYLKQRFDDDYSRSPGLAHMVKLNAKTRRRPKRSIGLDSGLRELVNCKNEVTLNQDIKRLLQERLNPTFSHFRRMVEYSFDTKEFKFSKFQLEGLHELFKASISREFKSSEQSFIIQSNTGSGKTEAFLFPILLYTLLTYDQKGTKAFLIYPRIDLCNDQLQRLIRYVWIINHTGALDGKKIRISLQHGGFQKVTIP